MKVTKRLASEVDIMQSTPSLFRWISLAVPLVLLLTLWVIALPAQSSLNTDWAGGGVYYDRQGASSVRYVQRSRARSQELQSYGSVRYSSQGRAMLSLDSPGTSLDLQQQTLDALPEGAREVKVSEDLTYYSVDGKYYRKAIEGGRVKYVAVQNP